MSVRGPIKRRRGLARQRAAAPVGLCLVLALPAAASDRDTGLDARLARLEAEVARLQSSAASTERMDRTRADEIRGLVRDVLTDADRRASLLRNGLTAGWDGHPFIASADGTFRLEIEGRVQLRYVTSIQDDAPGVTDATQGGFENRRVRSIFSGNVIDPSVTYKLQATFNRGSGALRLEDAFIQKDFGDDFYLRAGQFRPPFTREANVSTFRTTAVERSIAHGAIELSRSQGVEVGWSDSRFFLRGGFNEGDSGANTSAFGGNIEFALSARGEILVAGEHRQFRDFNGWRDGDAGLLIGAGVHYERGEFGAMLPARADDLRWTFDLSADFIGASLYVAVGGRHVDPDAGTEVDVIVAVIQGAVFLTDDVEAFARFEWGDDGTPDDLALLTIGATKYWRAHKLKWTTDIGYAFDTVTGTFASTGSGWRQDPSGTERQVLVRSQFQLMF